MGEVELAMEAEVRDVEEEAEVEGAGAADEELVEGGPATTAVARDEIGGEGARADVLQQELRMFLQRITGLWLHS